MVTFKLEGLVDEKDVMENWGATRHSLEFWELIKNHPDFDIRTIHTVEMTFSDDDWYRLHLYSDDLEIIFRGFSAGYGGEGSRGTFKVLVDLGYRHPEIVFEQENKLFEIDLFVADVNGETCMMYDEIEELADTFLDNVKALNKRYNRNEVKEYIEDLLNSNGYPFEYRSMERCVTFFSQNRISIIIGYDTNNKIRYYQINELK